MKLWVIAPGRLSASASTTSAVQPSAATNPARSTYPTSRRRARSAMKMNTENRVGAFSEKDGGCMYEMWKLQINMSSSATFATTNPPSRMPASRRR